MGFLVRCDHEGEDVFPSAEMQRGTRPLLPVRDVDEVKKRYWRKLSIAESHQPKVLFVTVDTIDRAEEWRRLKELYLRMSDEELEVVANNGYDLTDVARQALHQTSGTKCSEFGICCALPEVPLRRDRVPQPRRELVRRTRCAIQLEL
jgi:hypothetical protein